ncbi:MAG: helix-turn-helix domain-containing protein [Phycisphaerae bacterium]
MTEWRIGDLRVDYRHYAPSEFMSPHAHDFSVISIVVRGCVEEIARGRSGLATIGCAAFKPAGFEHADRFGPDGSSIVSLRWTSPTAWPAGLATGAPAYEWCGGGALALGMRRLASLVAELHGSDDLACRERIEQAALDVGGAVCANDDECGGWVEAARDYVHAHFDQSVSLGDCAERVGRHPVSVARAFRRRFGCSVIEYAHRLRIEHAMQRLRGRDARLADVALSVGYADQAHFCRFFRRMTGRTPGQHRRLSVERELVR